MSLPSTLGPLLRVALHDLRALSSEYRIQMYIWHNFFGGKCFVCMAGAVMAKSLGIEYTRNIEPNDFPVEIREKLTAIDNMREGCFQDAAEILNDKTSNVAEAKRLWNNGLAKNTCDEGWYKRWHKIADALEGKG